MNNTLYEFETDELIVYSQDTYSNNMVQKCKSIFNTYVSQGKITGKFEDDMWYTFSGTMHCGINFDLDKDKYLSHVGKEFGISYETIILMLKCYLVTCFGSFIFSGIEKDRNKSIKDFLENYSFSSPQITVKSEYNTIEEFLLFINTPLDKINKITETICLKKKSRNQRQLSPVINYLAIADAVNDMFSSNLNDDEFIKWFPIYFWTNITFILPLRATEMLVTHKNCIRREKHKVYLTVRRTRLKGNQDKRVYYDIDKDYQPFTYEIPDSDVVKNIEKYVEMTSDQERKLLFVYNHLSTNMMFSLKAFNRRIAEFMVEHVIDNRKYDFSKYASGINRFEVVSAGDSRPIAMANLYFQNVSADVCRQLANHQRIDTSSSYYTNITEIVMGSSIMQFQKRLNHSRENWKNQGEIGEALMLSGKKGVCTSVRRSIDSNDLHDCIEQKHLADCIGCRYYRPSEKELNEYLKTEKKAADKSTKKLIKMMNDISKIKETGTSFEDIVLKVQTDVARYKVGCDEKVKEMGETWLKTKSSQRTYY
jgi:hypothetical protein